METEREGDMRKLITLLIYFNLLRCHKLTQLYLINHLAWCYIISAINFSHMDITQHLQLSIVYLVNLLSALNYISLTHSSAAKCRNGLLNMAQNRLFNGPWNQSIKNYQTAKLIFMVDFMSMLLPIVVSQLLWLRRVLYSLKLNWIIISWVTCHCLWINTY